jgi:hypothetical protein
MHTLTLGLVQTDLPAMYNNIYIWDYIYCALYDINGKLAHTLDSLVRVSRRAGHIYGSTNMNAARICMNAANVFAQPAPTIVIARPG